MKFTGRNTTFSLVLIWLCLASPGSCRQACSTGATDIATLTTKGSWKEMGNCLTFFCQPFHGDLL